MYQTLNIYFLIKVKQYFILWDSASQLFDYKTRSEQKKETTSKPSQSQFINQWLKLEKKNKTKQQKLTDHFYLYLLMNTTRYLISQIAY